MMDVLFLDIDGVLNDHTPLANRYCGTQPRCVCVFNDLLDDLPDLKIVISSAWRYMILRGDVTLNGFEMLLKTHGVKVHQRLVGCTGPDGRIEDEPDHHNLEAWNAAGLRWRREQIRAWVAAYTPKRFAVLDDLPLDMPELVQTDGQCGLTDAIAARVRQRFMEVPQ